MAPDVPLLFIEVLNRQQHAAEEVAFSAPSRAALLLCWDLGLLHGLWQAQHEMRIALREHHNDRVVKFRADDVEISCA